MPKGEQRGNREVKKPKKEKPKVIAAQPQGGYNPSKTVGANKEGSKKK